MAFEIAEMATSEQIPITTTLYDLIAALQEEVEPWEADRDTLQRMAPAASRIAHRREANP